VLPWQDPRGELPASVVYSRQGAIAKAGDERSEAGVSRLLGQYGDDNLSLTEAAGAVTERAAWIVEAFGCDSGFEALGFVVMSGPR
jgi:hypothetical protein